MKKRTKRIITVISSFVLALSTTFAAYAGTSDEKNLTTVDNVNFYIFSPLDGDSKDKEAVVNNPLGDSSSAKWTKKSADMSGSITFDSDDYSEYYIDKSSVKSGYVSVEDVSTIVTKAPTTEAIKKAVESKWLSYEYDSTKYGVKWIVAKYIYGSWHIDGVIVPLSELEKTTEETTTEKETTTVEEQTTEEKTTVEEQTTEEKTTIEEETTTAQGVVIEDEEIPLSDGQETTAQGVAIEDEEIPLSDGRAPQTGDSTTIWVFMLVAVLAAGTIVAVNAKKEEN